MLMAQHHIGSPAGTNVLNDRGRDANLASQFAYGFPFLFHEAVNNLREKKRTILVREFTTSLGVLQDAVERRYLLVFIIGPLADPRLKVRLGAKGPILLARR